MHKKYGLLGAGISYSFSPDLHNRMFERAGIDAGYSLIDIAREQFDFGVLSKALESFSGFNVTIPYKEMILGFLDEVDERARKIGAVNTVVLEADKWIGYNTDYYGFLYLYEQLVQTEKKSATILGTGGAAKMVYRVFEDLGFENITVVSRSKDGIGSYFENARGMDYKEFDLDHSASDVLVNCTPLGMSNHIDAIPVSVEGLSRHRAVIDLIYNPQETRLMREASRLGLKVLGGLDMLIVQALEAERIWTGIEMNTEENRAILKGMFR